MQIKKIMMSFKNYKNRHLGERCFILGNGPSLKEENLKVLENEKVFVVNKGYNALTIGLSHFDYYVCTDIKVYNECYRDIIQIVGVPSFYSSQISELDNFKNKYKKNTVVINRDETIQNNNNLLKGQFPNNFNSGWSNSRTVVVDAALIAFFMGFSKIYYLGVELFSTNDNNHFYNDSQREINERIQFNNKRKDFYKVFNTLSLNFKKYNVEFRNLSKGFFYKDMIETDLLENILGNNNDIG